MVKYIVALAVLIPAWTWALYSEQIVEQERNVTRLRGVEQLVVSERLSRALTAGIVTLTATQTAQVRLTETWTGSGTPTATRTR